MKRIAAHQAAIAVNPHNDEKITTQIQKANRHYDIIDRVAALFWFRPEVLYHQHRVAIRLNRKQ